MNTINQAEAIRDTLAKLGSNATPREVIRLLKEERGITVKPQQVSNEKARLAKRQSHLDVNDLPTSVIKKVQALVDELGSPEIVRRALDELEAFQRK